MLFGILRVLPGLLHFFREPTNTNLCHTLNKHIYFKNIFLNNFIKTLIQIKYNNNK